MTRRLVECSLVNEFTHKTTRYRHVRATDILTTVAKRNAGDIFMRGMKLVS